MLRQQQQALQQRQAAQAAAAAPPSGAAGSQGPAKSASSRGGGGGSWLRGFGNGGSAGGAGEGSGLDDQASDVISLGDWGADAVSWRRVRWPRGVPAGRAALRCYCCGGWLPALRLTIPPPLLVLAPSRAAPRCRCRAPSAAAL